MSQIIAPIFPPSAEAPPEAGTVGRSILFLVNAMLRGGAEIQVCRIAVGLRRRGWEVTVVSMIPPEALEAELHAAGVALHSLDMRPGIPNPAAIIKLRKILSCRRPQIVHSHMYHANLLGRVTRLFARIPLLICTAHNIRESGRAGELAYRFTDHLADLTTNVSQAAVQRFIRIGAVPAQRIRFIPNGLDVSAFAPDSEARARLRQQLNLGDKFAWLAIGRFEEAKDYPNLLRAFKTTPPNAILLVVGRGKLEFQLRDLAAALRIAERVRFLAVRNDVPALMNAVDGYVMSSLWEGMPLVLQEASATGLPIVATDVGGNADVVANGSSGILVPPANSEALGQAMRQVMALSQGQRQEMGRVGRRHVQSRFDMDSVLDQWEELYRELWTAKHGCVDGHVGCSNA
jgi:glycosyltransferase involved in cell wall biosynthesis